MTRAAALLFACLLAACDAAGDGPRDLGSFETAFGVGAATHSHFLMTSSPEFVGLAIPMDLVIPDLKAGDRVSLRASFFVSTQIGTSPEVRLLAGGQEVAAASPPDTRDSYAEVVLSAEDVLVGEAGDFAIEIEGRALGGEGVLIVASPLLIEATATRP